MTVRSRLRRRWLLLAVAALCATAVGVADGLHGQVGDGAAGAAFVLGFWVAVAAAPGEVFQLARGEGDERLVRIRADSAQIVLVLTCLVVFPGAVIEQAHGAFGPYCVVASTVGASILVVPQVLRRLR